MLNQIYRTVYKIDEEVHDDCVIVEVSINHPLDVFDIECENFVLPNGNKIKVSPLWGCYEVSFMGPNNYWHCVEVPNIFERLFGITFKDKINKARRICQKFIDKGYREQEKLNEALGEG